MAKNKVSVAGSKAVVRQSAATEPKVKPRRLGKAGRMQPAHTQLEHFSGSGSTQPQNPIIETRRGMPRPGYKRKGIVLPDEMIRELKHRAVDLGITDSKLVERAIRDYLDSDAA